MTDEERLETAINHVRNWVNGHFMVVDEKQIDLIIEQAERAQGLVGQVEELGEYINYLHRSSEQMQQSKRYREALQRLSDLGRIENCLGQVVIEVARKALEGEK